jgi:hypothetical protein
MEITVKYGLPGKEHFEIRQKGTVEIFMEAFGHYKGMYFHPASSEVGIPGEMKDEAAETAFRRIRWANTNGEPVCPHCGGTDAYDCRRFEGCAPVPLPSLRQGFQHHVRHPLCQPQVTATLLSRGHRDLL